MVPFLKKSLSIFLPLTRRGVLTSHLRGYSYSERRGSFMSDVKSSSSFRHSTASPCAHRNPLLENVLDLTRVSCNSDCYEFGRKILTQSAKAAKLRRVSFAPLRKKIICDLPAFSQSERRETELLPPFETQMFVPSKTTLQGDLPTLNVLTIAPRRGSICATELLP